MSARNSGTAATTAMRYEDVYNTLMESLGEHFASPGPRKGNHVVTKGVTLFLRDDPPSR